MARFFDVVERHSLNWAVLTIEFEKAISSRLSETEFYSLHMISYDLASSWEELPVHLRLFKYACISHNPNCLQYVITQYQALKHPEQGLFKTQMEQQLQQFRQDKFVLCDRILQIIQEIFPEMQAQDVPNMRMGNLKYTTC